MDAKEKLEQGVNYPYDYREPIDAAHRAALGVLADLTDRRGVGHELTNVDLDIKVEIVETLAAIIREAGLRA
jgi:hypothetical protein